MLKIKDWQILKGLYICKMPTILLKNKFQYISKYLYKYYSIIVNSDLKFHIDIISLW